ncbi:kynureninase [Aureimonas sp. SK2]|uniref:kynureninase n=1 Tax=Aureimonas sp. SK2 TaxID=3015992 RepID=UPI0024443153|nr:kynureninase [Aureimonas sp. SK2]
MSANDPFRATRALFDLPEGVIYLDGNSLGALPKGVSARVSEVIANEWGRELIGAWNSAGWVDLPRRVGDRVGRLIGAPEGTVVMGDTLSIKVYQALAAALDLVPQRRVILSDTGNFPTDLYMAEGLIASLGRGHELRVVEPEAVEAAIEENVAAVMLTQVDYRTGRLHDMAALTAKAHAAGALAIWDLAHSAGALPVDVAGAKADFAVGCTYKYLNGGPGAPAFIYVAPHLAESARPALSGWFGHEAPFAFEPAYRPAAGVERMRVGTPPILALAALDAALDVWDGIDMETVRARSIQLGELFIRAVQAAVPGLELASPKGPAARGSQVSFRHADGYAVMQALIAEGVIGDYRAPDIMRFGFTPLYLGEDEVRRGAAILADILTTGRWDTPEFRRRNKVT